MIFFATGEMGGIPKPQFPPITAPPGPPGPAAPPLGTVPAPVLTKPEAPPSPPPGPSWCLGAEVGLCGAGEGVPLFGDLGGPGSHAVCRATMNAVCLVVGLFVILALLGVSLNALVR